MPTNSPQSKITSFHRLLPQSCTRSRAAPNCVGRIKTTIQRIRIEQNSRLLPSCTAAPDYRDVNFPAMGSSWKLRRPVILPGPEQLQTITVVPIADNCPPRPLLRLLPPFLRLCTPSSPSSSSFLASFCFCHTAAPCLQICGWPLSFAQAFCPLFCAIALSSPL